MGTRLSKIYTRTGDDGTTGLADGSRISKLDPRVEAMGDVDELNSVIGVLMLEQIPDHARSVLIEIQHNLFDLGGELAMPGHQLVKAERVDWLERQLDELNLDLEPLKEFILPGGARPAALAHLARAVCRRAERRLCAVYAGGTPGAGQRFVNRLSDFLFVLARYLNKSQGRTDVLWNNEHRRGRA